jgi:hypothetical protein
MGKIGRNQPCPCGSGKKYKHCCRLIQQNNAAAENQNQAKVTLMAAIEKIQKSAENREVSFFELGVFLFYATSDGDAWLLEITEQDAVQVAKNGSRMEVPVEENDETIEMNWSHIFTIKEKQLFMTDYAEKVEQQLESAPVQQISAAIKRIKKRFSSEDLGKVHVASEEMTTSTDS